VNLWRLQRPASSRVGCRVPPHFDPTAPRLDVIFVLDTTGSMGSSIDRAKTQVQTVMEQLEARYPDWPVCCNVVSYKDFGDRRHLEHGEFASASDREGMEKLVRFIRGLEPTGGGDHPEDVAGGLEKAIELFNARPEPSLRLAVLIADAPAHGFCESGDRHPKENGVCQRTRTLKAVKQLCGYGDAADQCGAELLVMEVSHGVGRDMLDTWGSTVGALRSTLEVCDLSTGSDTAFREVIAASIEAVCAHAVCPAEEIGADVFVGTDMAVPLAMCTARMAAAQAHLADRLAGGGGNDDGMEVEGAAEEEGGMDSSDDARILKDTTRTRAAGRAVTAYANLVARLMGSAYDPVRAALQGCVREGLFSEIVAAGGTTLAEESVAALLRAGATGRMLREAGYPEPIAERLDQTVLHTLARA